jgi:hypothetical protein
MQHVSAADALGQFESLFNALHPRIFATLSFNDIMQAIHAGDAASVLTLFEKQQLLLRDQTEEDMMNTQSFAAVMQDIVVCQGMHAA